MLARRSLLAAGLAAAAPSLAFADRIAPPLPPALPTLAAVPLTLTDGGSTTLSQQLAPGAASVVTFWATWCGPCALEARHLGRMRTRITPARLNILGVNVDTRANEIEIARFLQAQRAFYAQVRGTAEAYAAFGCGQQIMLPRLFVFSRTGRPVAAFDRYIGEQTSRRIDEAVEAAMGA
jgi:cytochrome c biogenesis protein CcmG, thiol:disulfide interchange protein DsbE